MRVPPALQSVTVRTGSLVVSDVVSDTCSKFGVKVQLVLEQTARSARMAYSDQLANMFVAFLTPASLVALVLGLWRVSADVGWTESFVISSGFFSHWQVWIALAIGLKSLASWGNANYARSPKISE